MKISSPIVECKYRWILLLLLVIWGNAATAQTRIEACVVDSITLEPLPYCHVAVSTGTKGTVTNEDGCFYLQDLGPDDTLVISYIGYSIRSTPVSSLVNAGTIYLSPQSTALGELTVYADDDILYQMVYECSQTMKRQPLDTARAYFNLETLDGDSPLEMIECYYNSSVRGVKIHSLELKNGRVGWPVYHDGRYYINHSTSKAFVLLDLVEPSGRFPLNPLQFKPGKMKKRFDLRRLPDLSNEDILHIAFTPVEDNGEYFSGEVWIDRKSSELLKIDLEITDAGLHPFQPFNAHSNIDRLDFFISYTFNRDDGALRMQNVNFNYNIILEHDWAGTEEEFAVSTRGLLYLFDYNETFILPFFEYSPEHSDYRKISFFPYDSMFWNNNLGYEYSKAQRKRIEFLELEGVLLNFESDFRNAPAETAHGFFEQNNIKWSADKRIDFKMKKPEEEDTSEGSQGETLEKTALITDKLKIALQIFLDVNEYGEGYSFTSATVIDVFNSYNTLEDSDLVNCVANIYFDLGEIARREMINRLNEADGSIAEFRRIYDEATRALSDRLAIYMKDVQHGLDLVALHKWNEMVKAELGIDNVSLFRIIQEADAE